jgi:hypothetical protein
MFFGQINAPATLSIYVRIHHMNSKFLGRLYTSPCRLFVFMQYNWRLSSPTEMWDRVGQQKITLWSLIHTAKLTVRWSIYVWRRVSYSNFLAVYPTRQPGIRTWADRQAADAVWSQNTDAIYDYRSQDTLLINGTRTNCPYMLMPKVYGFLLWLCYILVQFPPYSSGLFEILDRKPCEVTFFP